MEKEYAYIAAKDEKGKRLDLVLSAKKEINLTRTQIQKLIVSSAVKINGRAPKPGYKLKINDNITLKIPPPQKYEAAPENIPLDVVYEDRDLIVVNKPRGMVVHPAAGNYRGTLVNALLAHCKDLSGIGGVLRPGIVHRLDKDTSGLMVAAKNDFAHQALARQFKSHQVLKNYLAIVHGTLRQNEGAIEAKIGRHPVHRKKMTVEINSKFKTQNLKWREAVTEYKILERYKDYTLVEMTPKTGRTHQIRVHMAHMGHPLAGDPVYGKSRGQGQLLHAAKLGFTHPRSGEYLEFYREMPEDMREIIKKLQKK